ncbi:MAG: hypothetical protein E7408_02220 [Ruminococcaceae bacterium]|nr:hypothetical protein [Oscillospiraceae bacterium]
MSKSTDFANMTLDELTPIISMRPGKEYSREQLREARAAFMAALGGGNDTAAAESQTTEEKESCNEAETAEPNLMQAASPLSEVPIPVEIREAVQLPEETLTAQVVSDDVSVPKTADTKEAAAPSPDADVSKETDEEFILRTDSRLARILYILYAYVTVPLLSAESLILLLSSVATIVAVPHVPHLFVHIFCVVLYTMTVTVAWHQLLYRTRFGLILNRALICVCILRGFTMVFAWGDILTGVIFIALSFLFLVFFLGYDSTFIIKSPSKRRGQ